MRLVTFQMNQEILWGIYRDEAVWVATELLPDYPSLLDWIAAGPQVWHTLPEYSLTPFKVLEHQFLAPLPRTPKNILCLGLNYSDHVAESYGARQKVAKMPEFPVVFTKAVTTINAPYGDIPYDPQVSTQIDWEVELAVVIGVGGRHIPRERALSHVFGYTVINDLTARDLQDRHKQFFLGKSLDGHCPMGPAIVTADEVPDPQNLDLACWVNGELKQSSNTRYQIFDIATTIATLSHSMTLEAGDVIATGTPSGVGFARTPQEFLRAGDVLESQVSGIGRMKNHVRLQVAE
ncbi:MAG TPA: fumarylacetoacetate hydrolase family protein [Anaerolineales bacterium]|nr:fumarylacetoacetate hydrolase family protein [Anaerolineales bacterium]